MTAQRNVRFATMMLSALSTGGFFGTRAALGPSTKDFTPHTYVEVQQATIRNLQPVMGTLLPAAVVANGLLFALSRSAGRSAESTLTAAALAAQLSALIVTGVVEIPINSKVMTWSPENPPQGWQALRDRWDTVHTARTAAAVVGFGCLVAAGLSRADHDGGVHRRHV